VQERKLEDEERDSIRHLLAYLPCFWRYNSQDDKDDCGTAEVMMKYRVVYLAAVYLAAHLLVYLPIPP